jgi:phosphatidylinositol glycan class B
LVFRRDLLLVVGFLVHICAAVFSIGYHQCDELFQVFEFAGFKLGINNAADLPWEYSEQMRSGIQPLIVFISTKAFNAISITNPFTIALFLRLFQATLSFIAIVKLLTILEKEMLTQKLKTWLWAFSLFFWCLPYFHARFSSENFSTTLFIFGLVIVLNSSTYRLTLAAYLGAGFLFGLSFLCRFQMSFFIIGLFAWLLFIKKEQIKWLVLGFAGLAVALFVGLLIDQWFYGKLTLTWWNYLDLNLFKDKASAFGKEPIYFYLEESLIQLIPPFSVLIIFSCFAFWKTNTRHVITWITIPFIFLHFFVSHKELRFLFPVINFLPFMIIFYFQSIQYSNNKFILFFKRPGFLNFAITVNLILLLFFIVKPADNNTHSLKVIYDKVEGNAPILYYEVNDPYNNAGSLNYFRNTKIKTVDLNADSLGLQVNADTYYFSEKFNEGEFIIKNNKKFERIYSNFPIWFSSLNFNGWLDRSFTFSIYKYTE